ncbi:MAG: hypothetical protein ACKON7_00145, partial [Planctomycetaceae bacterium]
MTPDLLGRAGELAAAAACGAVVGWIVTRAVARLVEAPSRPGSAGGGVTDAVVIACCAAAAAALWW